jgi:hypothetical protein
LFEGPSGQGEQAWADRQEDRCIVANVEGTAGQAIQTVNGHKSVAILRGYVQRANSFTGSPASKMFGAA